jgi:hypothetical protein
MVRATDGACMNVFYLQRVDGCVVIGADVPKFSERVLAHFIVGKQTC